MPKHNARQERIREAARARALIREAPQMLAALRAVLSESDRTLGRDYLVQGLIMDRVRAAVEAAEKL